VDLSVFVAIRIISIRLIAYNSGVSSIFNASVDIGCADKCLCFRFVLRHTLNRIESIVIDSAFFTHRMHQFLPLMYPQDNVVDE
jgi:hypothetical protein